MTKHQGIVGEYVVVTESPDRREWHGKVMACALHPATWGPDGGLQTEFFALLVEDRRGFVHTIDSDLVKIISQEAYNSAMVA